MEDIVMLEWDPTENGQITREHFDVVLEILPRLNVEEAYLLGIASCAIAYLRRFEGIEVVPDAAMFMEIVKLGSITKVGRYFGRKVSAPAE